MNDAVITVSNLVKRFGKQEPAVNDLSLTVPPGTVYGLIGRNGAGKTTALRILMGLLRPDRGAAHVLGYPLWDAPASVKERVTYVSQEQQLYGGMTVSQLSAYLAHFYTRWDNAYLHQLAERFQLPVDQPVFSLSGGQRRQVAILLALAPRPDVVLMDEPAAGLDPIARRQLIEELVDCLSDRPEMTVILSTHIIADIERLAEHVGIMDKGRLVASSRLDDLQARTRRVQVIFDGSAPPAGFVVPGAVRTAVEGPVVTAIARIDQESALDALRAQPGLRVQTFPLSLEDVFIEMLGPEARAELAEVA